MVVHDGVVDVEPLEVVHGRPQHPAGHGRRELGAEVDQLALEEHPRGLRLRHGQEGRVAAAAGRREPLDEGVVGGPPLLGHGLLAGEHPVAPLRAGREHCRSPGWERKKRKRLGLFSRGVRGGVCDFGMRNN